MWNHITDLLIRKGYERINQETEGILFRESEECVYMVTLSYSEQGEDEKPYLSIERKMEFALATRFAKKVSCLHLVFTNDGMFDDARQHLLEHLPNIWFVAQDTGRLYIFERQINEFDGIKDELEQVLKHCAEHLKNKKIGFRFTPVNTAIIILNVCVMFLVMLVNRDFLAVYDSDIMLSMGAMSYSTVMDGAWYQLVTSFFLHFGFSHLLNNMILLAYTGCELERRIGSITYLFVYMIFGIAGNVVSLFWHHGMGKYVVSAGASGAIYGVIGALLVLLIMQQIKTPDLSPRRIVAMIIISIYHGLTSTGVDNGAHIGGLVAGLVVGFLLSKISQYGKLE
ncbi:MAG: rhomboid family intramembrane serine protease [Lachnospiraceae bacterium]|nr:rhomboid family intramembrane serine protease [Lachnospiraceae bacterium]